MNHQAKSLRPFIGASDFSRSRDFYSAMGFEEVVISPTFSLFRIDESLSFYLQDYFIKDWIDNTMLFWEVEDLDSHHAEFKARELPKRFPGVRVSTIKTDDWGREYFVHDPDGILWHIGEFD